jgi:hypothetical protein
VSVCAPSRALLQAGKQAAGDGSGLTPTQRALLQFGVGLDTPDPSGTIGLNSWARAYLVIFSNIFDFFADTNGDGEPDGEEGASRVGGEGCCHLRRPAPRTVLLVPLDSVQQS